jgi:hypothetical protein
MSRADDGYMDGAAPAGLTAPRYGHPGEVRNVRRLIRVLARYGFKPHSVAIESEGYVLTKSARAMLCESFEWDAFITLRFTMKRNRDLFGVLIVQGNGDDIISDWSYFPESHPFSRALEDYAREMDSREVQ